MAVERQSLAAAADSPVAAERRILVVAAERQSPVVAASQRLAVARQRQAAMVVRQSLAVVANQSLAADTAAQSRGRLAGMEAERQSQPVARAGMRRAAARKGNCPRQVAALVAWVSILA